MHVLAASSATLASKASIASSTTGNIKAAAAYADAVPTQATSPSGIEPAATAGPGSTKPAMPAPGAAKPATPARGAVKPAPAKPATGAAKSKKTTNPTTVAGKKHWSDEDTEYYYADNGDQYAPARYPDHGASRGRAVVVLAHIKDVQQCDGAADSCRPLRSVGHGGIFEWVVQVTDEECKIVFPEAAKGTAVTWTGADCTSDGPVVFAKGGQTKIKVRAIERDGHDGHGYDGDGEGEYGYGKYGYGARAHGGRRHGYGADVNDDDDELSGLYKEAKSYDDDEHKR